VAIWLRAVWLAIVLIVPGGFVLFFGFALGRALVNRWRTVRASGKEPNLREAVAGVRLSDITREFRVLANAPGTGRRADAA